MRLEKLDPVALEVNTDDYQKLECLLEELEKRALPEEVSLTINHKIQKLNSFSGPVKQHKMQ